jgi:hypothetical protein
MPRVLKTVIPRIKKSLREKGIAKSIRRGFLLPIHLLREYRAAKSLHPSAEISEFDRTHGVETGGKFDDWTYLSDLEIPSPNWIEGNDYLPIEPERFDRVLASLDIRFEEFTFIDFGSGMGRALLLASDFPFREIIGLEFAHELHRAAETNISRYRSPTQKCNNIRSINIDFADFELPQRPLVLFFFDPCRGRVLQEVTQRIQQSITAHRRPVYILYIARSAEAKELFASTGVLQELFRNKEMNFCIYQNALTQKPHLV